MTVNHIPAAPPPEAPLPAIEPAEEADMTLTAPLSPTGLKRKFDDLDSEAAPGLSREQYNAPASKVLKTVTSELPSSRNDATATAAADRKGGASGAPQGAVEGDDNASGKKVEKAALDLILKHKEVTQEETTGSAQGNRAKEAGPSSPNGEAGELYQPKSAPAKAAEVHPDFTTGDFCLVSSDDIEFHIDSFHLRSASIIFRSMFTCSSGPARLALSSSEERAVHLAPFLRLMTGDMSQLQIHDIDRVLSLSGLIDKYECLALRALLRSQLARLAACGNVSPFHIFLLGAEDADWKTCSEAIRLSHAGDPWAKLETPSMCTSCHDGHYIAPAGGKPLPLSKTGPRITLLDPAGLDATRFASLAKYPVALLALMRAIEYSKAKKGHVSSSTASAFFLQMMTEYSRTRQTT